MYIDRSITPPVMQHCSYENKTESVEYSVALFTSGSSIKNEPFNIEHPFKELVSIKTVLITHNVNKGSPEPLTT